MAYRNVIIFFAANHPPGLNSSFLPLPLRIRSILIASAAMTSSTNTNGAGGGSNNLPPLRQTPLTCSGHTRPVVDLAFSDLNPEDEAAYYCISACKGIGILIAGRMIQPCRCR